MMLSGDFDTCPTGTRQVLSEQHIRLLELEAENQSLKAKIIVAEFAMQLTPGQFDILMKAAASLTNIFEETVDEAA